MAPFRQIGRDLIASDDVQFSAGCDQIGKNHRLFGEQITEKHRKPVVSGNQCFVCDDLMGFDRDAMEIESLGEELFLRRVDDSDFRSNHLGRLHEGPWKQHENE